MNILDYLKFQLEPGVGKLFCVPDSGKLAGMCWSKQEMYHERFNAQDAGIKMKNFRFIQRPEFSLLTI